MTKGEFGGDYLVNRSLNAFKVVFNQCFPSTNVFQKDYLKYSQIIGNNAQYPEKSGVSLGEKHKAQLGVIHIFISK